MAWERYGEVMADDGQPGADQQIGNAASVRFRNPDLPGRLVTVYAYPDGVDIPQEDGDRREVTGIQSQTEFMICRDIDEPGSTEEWCDYQYGDLDIRPLKTVEIGGLKVADVEDAEGIALAWIKAFDANRDIHWDGEPF